MKLQAITMIAVLSVFASASADAQNLKLKQFNRPQLQQTLKQISTQKFPITQPGPGRIGKFPPQPHPLPSPIRKPPVCEKPPIIKPPIVRPPIVRPPVVRPPIVRPPICEKPPIAPPQPPVCIKPPVRPPVCVKPPIAPPQPPICIKPPVKPPICVKPPVCVIPPVKQPGCGCKVCQCQVCHCDKPISRLPINRPPVKVVTMKLMNNAGSEVHFSLNDQDVTTMNIDEVSVVESRSLQAVKIAFHNGVEVVEYELEPSSQYSFEWEGEALQLLEVRG